MSKSRMELRSIGDVSIVGTAQQLEEIAAMRKIVAGLFMSLDGVVEAPETWHLTYFNDEMGEIVGSQMAAADTMLLGRRTYEEFAAYWSDKGSDVEFADTINNTPKLVASTTLTSADWQNSTLIQGNVGQELRRLKEEPGKDISITGSPTLVRSLLAQGLLDELRLLMHPIVVGSGKRLFEPGELERLPLKLVGARPLATGVIYLTYVPAD
jgi:dihydrofolate reductase